MSKRIAVYAGAALVTTGAVASAPIVCEAQQARGVSVAVAASRVTLSAQDAPLAEVLTAIGREAGITVVLKGDITNQVTETVVDAPLDDVVRRLTRGHSVVLVYDPAPDRPDHVVLTGVRVMGVASGRVTVASENRREMIEPNYFRHQLLRSVRNELSQARSPDFTAALRRVSSRDATRIVQMLLERGAPVVRILRTTAMTDPDPEVRRGAIRVLASLDSHDAVEAVRASIGDVDPMVRSEATTALRRLDAERRRKQHRQ
jgi:hypothetical protein